MVSTPVCTSCGLIPVAELEFIELKKQLAEKDSEIGRLRKQIEWMWSNCRIVYYPCGIDPMKGAYPIEHYVANGVDKDNRENIELYNGTEWGE
jgi:hypothetical protein